MSFLRWRRPPPVPAPAAPAAFSALFEWGGADLLRLAIATPTERQALEARRAWLIDYLWPAYPRLLAQAGALRTAWCRAGTPEPLPPPEAVLQPHRIELSSVRDAEHEWVFEAPAAAGTASGQRWRVSCCRLSINGYRCEAAPPAATLASAVTPEPEPESSGALTILFERTEAQAAAFKVASATEQAALRAQESQFSERLRPHLGALRRRALTLLHVLAREGIVRNFQELAGPGQPEPFEEPSIEVADYERELFDLYFTLTDSPAHPYENVYLLYHVRVQGLLIVDVRQRFH